MINDDIVVLHELRKQLAAAKNMWNAKAQQFDIDNKELKESAASLAQQEAVAEAVLRSQATEIYEANPANGKTVAPGIKIQDTISRGVTYDKEKVFTWCMERKGMFLAVDAEAFETYALAATELPEDTNIIEGRVIKATIAKDLFTAVNEIQEAVTA